jgi:steroid delta-isomerase-like uncharacterized protein
MSEKRSVARRYYEDFMSAGGSLDLADELMTPDVVFHNPISPDGIHGLEAYKEFGQRWYTGFPDRIFTVDDEVAEGDQIAIRFTITGTHLGPFAGTQPTGNRIEVHGMNLFRLEGGKIKDVQAFFNPMELYGPIGLGAPAVAAH